MSATPFILARAGLTHGAAFRHFDVLATYAYVGFFAVVGVLFGGCGSVVASAVCPTYEHHALPSPDRCLGRRGEKSP